MQTKFKLKNTIKYPTSLIINGATTLGLEIAESLLEQGGYVIIIDGYTEENVQQISNKLGDTALVSLLDYSAIPHLEQDIRRLDYVFYLAHEGFGAESDKDNVSTQAFLKYSNYLDSALALTTKFEAKFLLTTSIKAHQMLMASMNIDVNFGKDAKVKHAVYTDMEVQRYAESLALEYVGKAGLNARIVRLGEIIGEGMDFTRPTIFAHLVLSAVAGANLELLNDGLDSEWYVHMLDAAYGIIKAQFTRDTVGEIYSLAYENTVTHLSIAYKLQELEPEAKEITFREDVSDIPPLRLHKPAPNLSHVGWRPKIEFDQAVKESLAAAKLYVLNYKLPDDAAADDTIVGKIRSFLSLAKQEGGVLEAGESGPVSRLIAERKRQEQARQLSINKADDNMKFRRRTRPRTTVEKIGDWFWQIFLRMRSSFGFLRNMTPGQFLGYTILGIILLFLYFTVFSPVIVLGRNVLLVNAAVGNIEHAIAINDFSAVSANSETLYMAFTETAEILNRYQPTAKLLALDGYLDKYIKLVQTYGAMSEGVKNVTYAVVPLQEYLQKYIANTRYRPNTDSYLSVGTSTDYSPILDEMNARKAYATLGKEKLAQASLELAQMDLSFLPEYLRPTVTKMNIKLLDLKQVDNYANLADFGSEILGVNTPKSYLIMVLDNSRPMPIGGELSAFLLVTLQNGAITEARLQSVDSFTPDMSTIPSFALSEINLHAFSPKAAGSVALRDLGYIGDAELFANVAQNLWGKSFGRTISATMLINYSSLEDLLSKLGSVEVEGQEFKSDNLLQNLSTMQVQNATVQRRNDLIAQTFALILDEVLQDFSHNFSPFMQTLAESAQTKDIVLPPSELGIADVLAEQGLDGTEVNSADMPVYVYMANDIQTISPVRYPSFNEISKITVNNDSSLRYEVVIKFPSVANLREVALCVPLTAKNLKANGVAANRMIVQNANNRQCAVVSLVSETELSYSWDSIVFESSAVSEYNLTLGQAKLSGAEVISDTEINLAPGLSFANITPNITPIGGKLVFTQSLQRDQLIELKLSK